MITNSFSTKKETINYSCTKKKTILLNVKGKSLQNIICTTYQAIEKIILSSTHYFCHSLILKPVYTFHFIIFYQKKIIKKYLKTSETNVKWYHSENQHCTSVHRSMRARQARGPRGVEGGAAATAGEGEGAAASSAIARGSPWKLFLSLANIHKERNPIAMAFR